MGRRRLSGADPVVLFVSDPHSSNCETIVHMVFLTGYDGGDCCQCDCVDGDYYECGDSGYACIDESSSCVDDDDYDPDAENTCFEAYKSDGMCD
ncbi:unnamed protein product, partial [Ectocarpus sp. 8 AP-2014]